jgi:hypothetical protein
MTRGNPRCAHCRDDRRESARLNPVRPRLRLAVSVTREEYEHVAAAANGAGLTVPAWLERVVMAAASADRRERHSREKA